MFPLIFQFPLNVPYSCKSANKLATAACKESISTTILFFSSLSLIVSLITDLLSVITSEYLYFCKMKTYKISSRKVKISISLQGGNFQFSAQGERYVYLKKTHPGVDFTSPTCNIPLSLPINVTKTVDNFKISSFTCCTINFFSCRIHPFTNIPHQMST